MSEESEAPFTRKSFSLLQILADDPTADTCRSIQNEFEQHVKQPFQRLFRQAADQLPDAVRTAMEHERNLFSRIPKNDFGKGGAHPYYWGALYPKGGKRTDDPQLSLWIDSERRRARTIPA